MLKTIKDKGFTPYIIFQRFQRFCVFSKKKRTGSCITGFTLVEMLIAIALFMIVIGSLTGFFLGAVQAQRKALADQELIDNVSYNLEYMSRAIRMARKDIDGACLTAAGAKYNYETNDEENRIRFLNYQDQGKCQEFFLADGRLYERQSTDKTAANFGPSLPLTPVSFQITRFLVHGSETWGQSQDPLTQPKVTLYLEIGELKVQTTISQRNLNVKR